MDKKKIVVNLKKAGTIILRIRWFFKVFLAFGTGVYTGLWTYRKVHVLPEWSNASALGFAFLKGIVATAFTLLILTVIRMLVRMLLKLAEFLICKIKDRNASKEDARRS